MELDCMLFLELFLGKSLAAYFSSICLETIESLIDFLPIDCLSFFKLLFDF